jgi:hypothetical protein
MTDVITIISNNWDKTKTDNIIPKIFYEAPESPFSHRNFNQCISFDLIEDDIDDLGLNRSHQDVESKDMFTLIIKDFTKALCMKFVREIRRICRIKNLLIGDDEYSWLDWQGGTYTPHSYWKQFDMRLFAFRAGVSFDT